MLKRKTKSKKFINFLDSTIPEHSRENQSSSVDCSCTRKNKNTALCKMKYVDASNEKHYL